MTSDSTQKLISDMKKVIESISDWANDKARENPGCVERFLYLFFPSPRLSFDIKAKIFHSNPDIFQFKIARLFEFLSRLS